MKERLPGWRKGFLNWLRELEFPGGFERRIVQFHPHLLDLIFGNPHSMADTMRLVSAFKVEEDL